MKKKYNKSKDKCKAVVLKVSKNQIGKSVRHRDLPRKALKPGKRLSRNNKVYYEKRKNRSDPRGQKSKTFKKKKC